MIVKTNGGTLRLSFGYSKDKKNRKVTRAILTLGDELEQIEGVALCAKEDHFVKETGRKIALTKAIAPLPRDVRALIWNEYFSRIPNKD